jgi:hypothetical protein
MEGAMASYFLYGLSVILLIYVIFRIFRKEPLNNKDAIAALALLVSMISALRLDPPPWPPVFNQGELVFSEDFNDGVANGLEPHGVSASTVSVDKTDMALQVINAEQEWSYLNFPNQDLGNGRIEYRINLVDYDSSLGDESGAIAFHFRSVPEDRKYLFATVPGIQSLSLNYQGFDTDGIWEPLTKSTTAYNLNKNTWHKIKLELSGSNLEAYFDNVKVLSASDDRLETGGIILGIGPKTTILLDDFSIWEK